VDYNGNKFETSVCHVHVFLSLMVRFELYVQCFQGAKVEIEAIAVVGNIVDQD